MPDKKPDGTETTMEVLAMPEKTIPKYATNVNFSKLANGDIIMTFLSRINNGTPATLVETVIVDLDHAKKIVEVLDGVIKKEI